MTLLSSFYCADYNILNEPPEAVDLTITAVSDSTVSLSWSPADPQNFASYDLYAGLADDFDTTDSPTVHIEYSFDTSKTVRHLKPDTRYFFRVFVKNQSGLVNGSNVVDTVTLRDRRLIHLFRPEPDSFLDTVVNLRWTHCDLPDFGAYAIYCDTAENKVDTGATPWRTLRSTDVDDTTATITGLRRGRTYWFQVHVEGFFEDFIAASQKQSILIDSTVPGAVVLSVDTTLPESVTLSWTQCTSQVFMEYRVYSSADTGIEATGTPCTTLTSVEDTTVTISGLDDTTQTWFRVFSVARNGLTSGSNEVANYPVILNIASTTDTSVALQWTRSESKQFGAYAVYTDTVPAVTERSTKLTTTSITDPLTTTFTHGARDSSRTRYYRVFHYEKFSDALQKGMGSNVVSVRPIPHLRVSVVSSDTVALSWTRCLSPEFEEYRVYSSTDTGIDGSGQPYTTITSAEVSTIRIAGFSDTVQTWFRVYTVYQDSTMTGSNRAVNYPVILRVPTTTDTTVSLRWTKSVSPSFYAYAVFSDTVPEVTTENSRALTPTPITEVLTTTFTDTQRDSVNTVYYRVFEYEKVGTDVQEGVGSNTRAVLP